jgi:hypothetical protein
MTPAPVSVPDEIGRRLVSLACRAPSVHNTQPWAWRLRPDGADLYADHQRRLSVADPVGRELTISCGAALHHFQVAARAMGWAATVRRLPDAMAPALLAQVRLSPAVPPRRAAGELAALRDRCTDRRRFTSWPVPDDRLAGLADAAREQGVGAIALTDATDRFRVDLLVSRALQLQARDPALADEQQTWLERHRGYGVPVTSVPDRASSAESHRSRFGLGTLEDEGRDVEGSDGLIALCAGTDSREAWLRAGEGLSALWLRAVRTGLSVVPLSQVLEVDETRAALRYDVFGGLAVPMLLVRVGWQAIRRSQLVPTPRRPLDSVLLPAERPTTVGTKGPTNE